MVLCLLMGDAVPQLLNNFLFPLYRLLLFNFHFLGYSEWFCLHRIMLIHRCYCSLSFPWPVIHFASNYNLMGSLPCFFSSLIIPGSLPSYFWKYCLYGCRWPCSHVTRNTHLDPVLKHISSSLFLIFLQMFELPAPCFLLHYVSVLQLFML